VRAYAAYDKPTDHHEATQDDDIEVEQSLKVASTLVLRSADGPVSSPRDRAKNPERKAGASSTEAQNLHLSATSETIRPCIDRLDREKKHAGVGEQPLRHDIDGITTTAAKSLASPRN
jgi:hypothetical protein